MEKSLEIPFIFNCIKLPFNTRGQSTTLFSLDSTAGGQIAFPLFYCEKDQITVRIERILDILTEINRYIMML